MKFLYPREFRIRGKNTFKDYPDYQYEHYCFGKVLIDNSKSPSINFLFCDTSGIAHVELLGKDKDKHWWHQETNLMAQVSKKLGKENVKIYTNADIIQTSNFGCAFFASYGCFDLSNVNDYLPDGYNNIFEYMDNVVKTNHKAIVELKQKFPNHFKLYEEEGITVSLLPQHVIRNQESFGGNTENIEHHRGLMGRIKLDGKENTMTLKGKKTKPVNSDDLVADLDYSKCQTLQDSYCQHRKFNNSRQKWVNSRLDYKIKNSKQDMLNFLSKDEAIIEEHVNAILVNSP